MAGYWQSIFSILYSNSNDWSALRSPWKQFNPHFCLNYFIQMYGLRTTSVYCEKALKFCSGKPTLRKSILDWIQWGTVSGITEVVWIKCLLFSHVSPIQPGAQTQDPVTLSQVALCSHLQWHLPVTGSHDEFPWQPHDWLQFCPK